MIFPPLVFFGVGMMKRNTTTRISYYKDKEFPFFWQDLSWIETLKTRPIAKARILGVYKQSRAKEGNKIVGAITRSA